MKQYSQEEFDALPVENGRKQCPTGDYSQIKRFGERCSFGEWCSFGEGCKINDHTLSGFQLRSVEGLGEYKRKLHLWHTEDGFYCQAGCFFGTEADFRTSVADKYGDTHEYLRAIDFLKSF